MGKGENKFINTEPDFWRDLAGHNLLPSVLAVSALFLATTFAVDSLKLLEPRFFDCFLASVAAKSDRGHRVSSVEGMDITL